MSVGRYQRHCLEAMQTLKVATAADVSEYLKHNGLSQAPTIQQTAKYLTDLVQIGKISREKKYRQGAVYRWL